MGGEGEEEEGGMMSEMDDLGGLQDEGKVRGEVGRRISLS